MYYFLSRYINSFPHLFSALFARQNDQSYNDLYNEITYNIYKLFINLTFNVFLLNFDFRGGISFIGSIYKIIPYLFIYFHKLSGKCILLWDNFPPSDSN